MATVTQTQLVATQLMPAVDTSYFTSGVNTTTKIGRAVFTNTSAAAVTITAGVTAGVALVAGNTLISARSLAPGESYVSPELAGQVILAGSQIHGLAGTASVITLSVSGLTII